MAVDRIAARAARALMRSRADAAHGVPPGGKDARAVACPGKRGVFG